MNKLIDSTFDSAKDLSETGESLLKTGASLIGIAAVAGVVYVGFKTIFKGSKD
jgi:hypothetical protein